MTPITQTSSGLPNSKPTPVVGAKQLAATLPSERSEASGALVVRQPHEVLRALDASDRHGFQRYLADGTAEAAAALARAADPPRFAFFHPALPGEPLSFSIEDNHEAFARDGTILRSPEVDALLEA
jgi:hypothetical protein